MYKAVGKKGIVSLSSLPSQSETVLFNVYLQKVE